MIPAQAKTEHLLLPPAASTNSATRTANLDCAGAAYAEIKIALKSEINTNAVGPTISLLESDVTTVTNFATFNSDFERSAEDITNHKAITYKLDLRGRKRYLRLSVSTATATNDDITASATASLSRKSQEPATEALQAGDTNNVVVVAGL